MKKRWILDPVKMIVAILLICVCFMNTSSIADASVYDHFEYKKGRKLYKKSYIVRGKEHLTKFTAKKNDATQYQIVKMSKGKIVLRPQKGWHDSADPHFKKKKLTCKLSAKCKFYYRDAAYPWNKNIQYGKVSKKNVLRYMNDEMFRAGSGRYYYGGYFGEVYTKNGKVVAILMDGGD